MKFAIAVYGAPYSSQAPQSALHFARAVLNQGHEIYRVFFYHDGVYTGNKAIAPPQDEADLRQMWSSFATDNQIELIVCIASALRRGMLDQTEADRYEKSSVSLDESFTISGLGQLIDSGLLADRLVTFGA
jgi:tRNA 2-thiouridine synthesizing protein D